MIFLSICLLAWNWTWGARQQIKVACVGNSITYGIGLAERATQSYPAQLQQLLGETYVVKNYGKPGATLLNRGHRPYQQQEEYRQAVAFAADIVVIHLGINDTDPRNWPNYRDSFVEDYLGLIDAFRTANPNVRIMVARMTPIADRHPRFLSGTRDWHGEIQVAIETVARVAGAQLIDFHAPLYPYPFLLPDAVHPTAGGASIMARTVYSAITGDYGGLKLSSLYTDNMVLQRDVPLQVHGTADAGELVTVRIHHQQWTVQTAPDGQWNVHLSPLTAGGPYTLTVSTSRRTLKYENVLVGEVWLCSGQSNMEFMLRQAATGKEDIPHVADAQLRLYDMKARWRTNAVQWSASVLDSLNHLQYYEEAKWETATPESVARFSAIAYYFGKMLRDSLQVPVGLICNAIGGSPTEAWVDRNTLEYQFPAILKDWTHNDFIQDWVRERAALNIGLSQEKEQRHPYEPCYLYESGIRPLEQYPIRGVIWYQGESNAHNREAHEQLFKLLVQSWRKNWKQADLPFYYVQLSSIDRPSWPGFRDSQRRMMAEIPYTGMAVSSDQGDSLDVHPTNKKPIGERLARWALHKTYGWSQVVPSGPLVSGADFREESVYLSFEHGEGMKSSDGGPLRTFEVATTDGLYYPAVAEIVDGRLKVYNEHVKYPRYVRYGWQPFTRANLVNGEGLPASTFRMEASAMFVKDITWQEMKGFPSGEKGIEQGVAACYAGILEGKLLMAGGCNFPWTPASQGGKKKYYRHVYAAEMHDNRWLNWKKVGELPQSAAYGVSVTCPEGIICVGGMNEHGALRSVYKMKWNERQEKVVIETLPELPCTLDNMCGTLIGHRLFVAGGNRNGIPSCSFFCLDLNRLSAGWQELPEFPGNARTQAVCAGVCKGEEYEFYVWGGFAAATEKKMATLSVDGYRYSSFTRQWTSVAAPEGKDGMSVSLGGGTAVALNDSLVLCMGGVNKDIFLSALQHPEADYLLHPAEWYRLNDSILLYNILKDEWQEVARTSKVARAGAALTGGRNAYYYISGELKPGIRVPGIVKLIVK